MSKSIRSRVLDLCVLLAVSSFSITEALHVNALANPPSPQASIQAVPLPEQSFRKIDQQAAVAKHGSESDVRALTVSLVNTGGLPYEIANAYGFTDRIVNAEMLYRSGGQAAIRDSDVVTAVNNLFTTLGAPAWAQTDQAEVRKLRAGLMEMYPHLMASEAPPDQKGRYAVCSSRWNDEPGCGNIRGSVHDSTKGDEPRVPVYGGREGTSRVYRKE